MTTIIKEQRKFSILDALKQLFLHFRSPLEDHFKSSLRKIIKRLFKTSQTSTCFWCFISFSNLTFFFTRWKFPTTRHYFDLCFFLNKFHETILIFQQIIWIKWKKKKRRMLLSLTLLRMTLNSKQRTKKAKNQRYRSIIPPAFENSFSVIP